MIENRGNFTDVIAEDEMLLRHAIRYIRDNYQRPIGVSEVAREFDVSRRTLERKFA